MPALLVSDTSVLLDLHRGGILEAVFRLSFDFGVPDVLFARELELWDGPALEPWPPALPAAGQRDTAAIGAISASIQIPTGVTDDVVPTDRT